MTYGLKKIDLVIIFLIRTIIILNTTPNKTMTTVWKKTFVIKMRLNKLMAVFLVFRQIKNKYLIRIIFTTKHLLINDLYL